jgi:membrane protein implicated in regulation of membrane protease activity
MTLAEQLQWWNLIYIVPFGIGAFMVAMSVFGVLDNDAGDTADGGDADMDGDIDADGDDTDGDGDDDEGFSLARTLHIQNISPLMLLQNFMLFWGIVGWSVNQLLGSGAHDPARFIVPSLLSAFIGGAVLTILLSAVLSHFTPGTETLASTKASLIGRAGEAVSIITDKMGSVYVRDAAGTLHHLPGRIQPEDEPIKKGSQVVVIDYDEAGDFYRIKQWSTQDRASGGGAALLKEKI